jgi:hypothetical protein
MHAEHHAPRLRRLPSADGCERVLVRGANNCVGIAAAQQAANANWRAQMQVNGLTGSCEA